MENFITELSARGVSPVELFIYMLGGLFLFAFIVSFIMNINVVKKKIILIEKTYGNLEFKMKFFNKSEKKNEAIEKLLYNYLDLYSQSKGFKDINDINDDIVRFLDKCGLVIIKLDIKRIEG